MKNEMREKKLENLKKSIKINNFNKLNLFKKDKNSELKISEKKIPSREPFGFPLGRTPK